MNLIEALDFVQDVTVVIGKSNKRKTLFESMRLLKTNQVFAQFADVFVLQPVLPHRSISRTSKFIIDNIKLLVKTLSANKTICQKRIEKITKVTVFSHIVRCKNLTIATFQIV